MDLTPEQCFERAMTLIKRGKTDKAIKLLQIATLRAPGEVRYREALQTARTLKESKAAAPPKPSSKTSPAPEASEPVEQAPSSEPSSAASTLAEASAEELYQRALTLRAEGHTDRAARMMQIAAAKAPSEAKYREGVDSIRRPGGVSSSAEGEQLKRALQMSNYDEVERILRDALRVNREQPEKLQLLALLLLRIRDDPRGAQGPARESVRLAPRRLSGLVLLEDILRAQGDRSEAQRTPETIKKITTDAERLSRARKHLDDKIPVPGARRAAVTPTASSSSSPGRSPILLGGIVVVLLGILGGIWFMNQPDSIDITPYQSQLPAISASAPAPYELLVRVKEAEWRKLDRPDQECRLRGVMAEATSHGYRAVFVHSEQDIFLGSVQGGKTYLPK